MMTKQTEIKNYIINKISTDVWKVGTKIMSESQLMTYFKVSRVTVRLAITELCKAGILVTKKGSGTFVNSLNSIERKKYIIILTSVQSITGNTRFTYRNMLEYLNQLILKSGYTPITYLGDNNLNFEENQKETLKNTAGIIAMSPIPKDLNVVKSLNIPIVATMHPRATAYPTVIPDMRDLFNKINYLIQKYGFEDILVFTINPHLNVYNYVYYAIGQYYSKYNLIFFPIGYYYNMKSNPFSQAMKKLKKVPDAVIFMDDTIYSVCQPHFLEFDNILTKTKIITHSSGIGEFDEKYRICQVQFDIYKMSEKTVNLLIKLINREFVNEYNIYFDVKIINEEVLNPKSKI